MLKNSGKMEVDEKGKESVSVHDFLDILDTVDSLDSSQKEVDLLVNSDFYYYIIQCLSVQNQ